MAGTATAYYEQPAKLYVDPFLYSGLLHVNRNLTTEVQARLTAPRDGPMEQELSLSSNLAVSRNRALRFEVKREQSLRKWQTRLSLQYRLYL